MAEIYEFDPEAPLFKPSEGPVRDDFGGQVEPPALTGMDNFYAAQKDLQDRAAKALSVGDADRTARIRDVARHFSTTRYQAETELEYREDLMRREHAKEILATMPGTAQWLAENPLDAPLFKEDLQKLGSIESLFKQESEEGSFPPKIDHEAQMRPDPRFRYDSLRGEITGDFERDPESSTGNPELDAHINSYKLPIDYAKEDARRGFEAGRLSSQRGLLWYDVAIGRRSHTDEDFIAQDEAFAKALKPLTDGDTDGWLYNAGQFIGSMVGSAPGGVEYGTEAALAGLGMKLMSASAAATSAGIGAPVGITTAAVSGLVGAAFWYDSSRKVEAGLELQTLIEQGTDPQTALRIANGVGIINATIETGLEAAGIKVAMPIVKQFLSTVGARTVKALELPTARDMVLKGAMAYGKGVGLEVLTETMQEAVSALGEEFARKLTDPGADPADWGKFADRLIETAVNTMKGAAVLGLVPGVGGTAGAAYRAETRLAHAEAVKNFVHALSEGVNSTEAMKLAPSAMGEFVAAQAQGSKVKTFYIDAGALNQVLAETGVTREELGAAAPDVLRQVEAADRGEVRDVEISVEDFSTKIAPTNLGAALEEHVRVTADSLSFAEAKEALRLHKKWMKDAIQNPDRAEAELRARERAQDTKDRAEYQNRLKAFYIANGMKSDEAAAAARYSGLVIGNFASRTGLSFSAAMKLAPRVEFERDGKAVVFDPDALFVPSREGKAVPGERNDQPLKQINKLEMLRRSRDIDKQLEKWAQGKGPEAIDLGTPSWVLQIFGVSKKRDINVNRKQYFHVLFPKKITQQFGDETVEGKHGIKPEELQGLLAAIQQPIVVFASGKSTNKIHSIVLLTELTRVYNGKARNVIVPIKLEQKKYGELTVTNEILSTYEKIDYKTDWFEPGRLLGVEKTKGREVVLRYRDEAKSRSVPQVRGSFSSAADSSRPANGGPTPNTSVATERDFEESLPDGVIVYENETSVGDLYQTSDKNRQENNVNEGKPESKQGGESVTRGEFSPNRNTITLGKDSDISTVAHELSHWYLEALFGIVNEEGIDATIREDVGALLQAFGIKDLDAWNALSFEEKRKYHEQFAHWTEVYLAEGRSPVKGLEKFFQRFGAMIRAVYESFREGTQGMSSERISANYRAQIGEDLPDLPPEVRRVLDRMVASEEMLRAAEQEHALSPLFAEKPVGMSDAEWRVLQASRDEAFNAGTEKLTAAQAKDEKWFAGARAKVLRDIQRRGKRERQKIYDEVVLEINSRPGVAALDIISSGPSSAVTDNLRMDRAAVVALGYTEKQLAVLDEHHVFKQGGVAPATARELLSPFARFNTEKQMIDALLDAVTARDGIEKEVDRRMMERHSELITPEGRARIMTEALHNEARGRMVATELKHLAQAAKVSGRVLQAAARLAAIDRLDKMKIGETSVKQMLALESRAARQAAAAFEKGERLGAAMAKREQLVWHEAVREALDIEKELRGFKDLKKQIFSSDKALAKGRDTGYIAVARYILTNRGLGGVKPSEGSPAAAQAFVENLKAYDEGKYNLFRALMNEYGYVPDFKFSNMSVTQAKQLIRDVRSLWKQSADARKIELGARKTDLEETVAELTAQAEKHDEGPSYGVHNRATLDEELSSKLATEKLLLLRVESWCVRMDKGNPDGPFQKYIYRPIADAASMFRIKNDEYQGRLLALIKSREADWRKAGKIDAPEIRYTFSSKAELLGALLHTGNASNLEKLLMGGRGKENPWATPRFDETGTYLGMDTSRWDAFIRRCYQQKIITKEDMDFVQGVWDLLEETKPLAQEAFQKMYGYYFEEVQATPIQTPWGEYRGGYVPAKADRMLLAEQTRFDEADFMLSASSYAAAMPVTRPGFTKSRVTVYNPLDLDISRLCLHLQQTLKFSMIGPTANSVSKILNDKGFAEAIDHVRHGVDMALLRPWLARSFQQTVSAPSSSWIGKKLNELRGLAGMSVMALNLNNAVQQITGFTAVAALIPAKKLAHALVAYARDPKGVVAAMTEASPFMKSRLNNRAIEYQSQLESLASMDFTRLRDARGFTGKALALDRKLDPLRAWASRHAYCLQTAMQDWMDPVIWSAAYQHALETGIKDPKGFADSVVRRTQSDFSPENIAGLEAGSPLMRFFLVFYNYFGMQYNLLGDRWALAKDTKKYGRFIYDAALIVWVPTVLSELIAKALKGEGLDLDDDDDVDAWDILSLLIGSLVRNFISMIPVAGGILNVGGAKLAKTEDAGAPSDVARFIYGQDPFVSNTLSTPALGLIESSGSFLLDAARAANGADINGRRAMRNFIDLSTVITGVPLGPLKKPAGYLAGAANGDYEVEDAGALAKGLFTGAAPEN